MRENCTYGLTRGRAHPTRGVPLYSTTPSLFLAQQLNRPRLLVVIEKKRLMRTTHSASLREQPNGWWI